MDGKPGELTVLVDGQPVVLDGKVSNIDVTDVQRRATAAVTRLWELAQDKGVLART